MPGTIVIEEKSSVPSVNGFTLPYAQPRFTVGDALTATAVLDFSSLSLTIDVDVEEPTVVGDPEPQLPVFGSGFRIPSNASLHVVGLSFLAAIITGSESRIIRFF